VENNCSKCGVYAALATGNKSRKTGNNLYRSWCVSCEKIRKQQWAQRNRAKLTAKSIAWEKQNKDKRNAIVARYKVAHPDAARLSKKKSRNKNKPLYCAKVNERRKRLKQATPKSITEWDVFYIQELYHIAALRHLTVDHIVPIKHPLVCGLHVPANLQLMSPSDNYKKSNKWVST
jgi:hypothetical protein